MTPLEIFEHKKRWQRVGGYAVRLHSDLRSQGKDYCKVQMFKHQWDFSQYTDNYEDTFHFEYKQDADAFRNKFKKYADM
tara:strand:+ start:301 stop:537 length:237 start_codon:yes stop_codon:yes gene_type:complete